MKNIFSAQQLSIITGSLLGDGSIDNPRYGNSSFIKTQCIAHRNYLDWHLQQFDSTPCSIKTYPNITDGKIYHKAVFRVKAHPFFSHLRQEWYPNDVKIVPYNLILDPLALAIWYFDDGSNVVSARRISFATYCFSKSDVQFLSDLMFKNFGIKCYQNKKNVLIVHTESYKSMIDIVRPYMLWDCFKHKILYRDSLASPSCKKDIDKVIAFHKSGFSVNYIASQLRVTRASVYNQLQKHRVKLCRQSGIALNNTSGIKGVCYDKGRSKWVAYRKIQGKNFTIGRFDTKEKAGAALETAPASFPTSHLVPHSNT